eukprot:GGOE01021944.1.p1 GENE.GGOE01021944.1~~GGOE01021944.1.p1  ORF type:complete len:487 (+),score=86.16 GGOE01021944.1:47-1507(+)
MNLYFRCSLAWRSVHRTVGHVQKAFLASTFIAPRLTEFTILLKPAAPVDVADANRWIEEVRAAKFSSKVVGPLSCAYMGLSIEQRRSFLMRLEEICGVESNNVEQPSDASAPMVDLKGLWTVRSGLKSPYEKWFHQVLPMNNGLRFLITLRADLLKFKATDGRLSFMLNCLTEFLQNCMLPGWIHFRNLTPSEPEDTLEVLQNGDAVHPIGSRDALRLRMPPTPFRRCYALFHTFEPLIPLTFIQTALLPAPPLSMSAIFRETADAAGSYPRTSAIFYSINSTQSGLVGISLGHLLIKAVAHQLQDEGVVHFCTLSPMPGFRKWLAREAASMDAVQHRWTGLLAPEMMEDIQETCRTLNVPGHGHPLLHLVAALNTKTWATTPSAMARLERPATYAAIVYLTQLFHLRVQDPVQNFHLTNGACLWRVNFAADLSEKRQKESYGLMVNYFYDLACIDHQAQCYTHQGKVTLGEPCRGQMRRLALPCV